jgi:ABC-type branched-subunit amino acid transport system substrate-binding protein
LGRREARRQNGLTTGRARRRTRSGKAAALAACLASTAATLVALSDRSAAARGASGSLSLTIVVDSPAGSLLAQQNLLIARGATVAADELNAQKGNPVSLRLVTRSLDGLSGSAAESALHSVGADAVILPCDTDSEYQLAAELSKYHTLMFAPCSPDPSAGVRYPTYWGVGVGGNTEAAGLATFMESVGYRRVFIVNSSGANYMRSLTGLFRSAAVGDGLRITGSADVSLSTRNYSAIVAAVNKQSPRPAAVFTTLPPPYVNRLAAALGAGLTTGRNIGSTTLFGTTVMDTPATLSNPAPDGAIFASYGFLRIDAAAERFASDYRGRFHTAVVGGFPGLGLDTVRLIEEAVTDAKSISPTAIDQALSKGLTLSGVGLSDRTYTAAGDHSPVAQVGIAKVVATGLTTLIAESPSVVPLP